MIIFSTDTLLNLSSQDLDEYLKKQFYLTLKNALSGQNTIHIVSHIKMDRTESRVRGYYPLGFNRP